MTTVNRRIPLLYGAAATHTVTSVLETYIDPEPVGTAFVAYCSSTSALPVGHRLGVSYHLSDEGTYNLCARMVDPTVGNVINFTKYTGEVIVDGFKEPHTMTFVSEIIVPKEGFTFTAEFIAIAAIPAGALYEIGFTQVVTVGSVVDLESWQHLPLLDGETWTLTETGALLHLDRDVTVGEVITLTSFLAKMDSLYAVRSSNPLIPAFTGRFIAGQQEAIWNTFPTIMPHVTTTLEFIFLAADQSTLVDVLASGSVAIHDE